MIKSPLLPLFTKTLLFLSKMMNIWNVFIRLLSSKIKWLCLNNTTFIMKIVQECLPKMCRYYTPSGRIEKEILYIRNWSIYSMMRKVNTHWLRVKRRWKESLIFYMSFPNTIRFLKNTIFGFSLKRATTILR